MEEEAPRSRGKRKAPARSASVTINWVGDIALSTKHGLPADGGKSLLTAVTPELRSADLTIANLEGTLGNGGTQKCGAAAENCFAFQAPPSYAGVFARAGIDVMNVANNHAFDYGESGQAQTLSALDGAGIPYTGKPGQITVVRKSGIKIAMVGFAPYPWAAQLGDLAGARELVRRAGKRADVVVVLMHAGGEGTGATHTPAGREFAFGEDRGPTRDFAHTVVDAGADAVLGSGPHVVRGIERYHGKPIAYSLGDFLGYHTFGLAGALNESAILRVELTADGRFRGGKWSAVTLAPPGVPVPDPAGRSTQRMADLSRQDFGDGAIRVGAGGRLR